MLDQRDAYHSFMEAAASSEEEARRLLNAMDQECLKHGKEPFSLAEDGDVVDALSRAMALSEIGNITDVVRGSIKKHNVAGCLHEIVECAMILHSMDKSSSAVAAIDAIQERVIQCIEDNG